MEIRLERQRAFGNVEEVDGEEVRMGGFTVFCYSVDIFPNETFLIIDDDAFLHGYTEKLVGKVTSRTIPHGVSKEGMDDLRILVVREMLAEGITEEWIL